MALSLRGPHQPRTTSASTLGLWAATGLREEPTWPAGTPAMAATPSACTPTAIRATSSSTSTGPILTGFALWWCRSTQGSTSTGALRRSSRRAPRVWRRERLWGRSSWPSSVLTWWMQPWTCFLRWWMQTCWWLRSWCCRVRAGRSGDAAPLKTRLSAEMLQKQKLNTVLCLLVKWYPHF